MIHSIFVFLCLIQAFENKVINDGTNPVVNVVNGSPQYYIKSMNADIVVDVDHKTTYTDRASHIKR